LKRSYVVCSRRRLSNMDEQIMHASPALVNAIFVVAFFSFLLASFWTIVSLMEVSRERIEKSKRQQGNIVRPRWKIGR
jgi:hypothetical protein